MTDGKHSQWLFTKAPADRTAIGIVCKNEPLDDPKSDGSSIDDVPDTDPEQETGHLEPMNRVEGFVVETNNIISCLYKFSITIRNPTLNDKLERCSKIDVSHFELFDIRHAQEKYPGAEMCLRERLGMANTKRRQLLKYHAQHHRKITAHYDPDYSQAEAPVGGEPSQPPGANVPYGTAGAADATEAPAGEDGSSNLHALRADVAQTVTDTAVSIARDPEDREITNRCPDTDFSQTSFAASEACGPEFLRVPDPPGIETAYNKYLFQCHYYH